MVGRNVRFADWTTGYAVSQRDPSDGALVSGIAVFDLDDSPGHLYDKATTRPAGSTSGYPILSGPPTGQMIVQPTIQLSLCAHATSKEELESEAQMVLASAIQNTA